MTPKEKQLKEAATKAIQRYDELRSKPKLTAAELIEMIKARDLLSLFKKQGHIS